MKYLNSNTPIITFHILYLIFLPSFPFCVERLSIIKHNERKFHKITNWFSSDIFKTIVTLVNVNKNLLKREEVWGNH